MSCSISCLYMTAIYQVYSININDIHVSNICFNDACLHTLSKSEFYRYPYNLGFDQQAPMLPVPQSDIFSKAILVFIEKFVINEICIHLLENHFFKYL